MEEKISVKIKYLEKETKKSSLVMMGCNCDIMGCYCVNSQGLWPLAGVCVFMEYKRWYKGEVLYALFRYVLKGGGEGRTRKTLHWRQRVVHIAELYRCDGAAIREGVRGSVHQDLVRVKGLEGVVGRRQ